MNLCTDQSLKHVFRYEFTLIVAFGFISINITKMTLQTYYHANIGYLINWKMFMLAYGFMAMLFCIGDACYNYLWVNILGFFPPKPFGGFTVGTFIIPLFYALYWFRHGPPNYVDISLLDKVGKSVLHEEFQKMVMISFVHLERINIFLFYTQECGTKIVPTESS